MSLILTNTKPNSSVLLSFGTPASFGFNPNDDGFVTFCCEPNEKLNDGEPKDTFVKLPELMMLAVIDGLAVAAIGTCDCVPNVPELNFRAFAKQRFRGRIEVT